MTVACSGPVVSSNVHLPVGSMRLCGAGVMVAGAVPLLASAPGRGPTTGASAAASVVASVRGMTTSVASVVASVMACVIFPVPGTIRVPSTVPVQ